VKSLAGLIRKSADQLKELDGIGDKAVTEISEALDTLGLSLKGGE
jgi:DNA-directed RNA polymerase alpha subunit